MELTDSIFVIIVTYKGRQWYDNCFGSLFASDYPVRIIAVDNASKDGSAEYISKSFPEVHVIKSEKNLGFGKANNLGIKYALSQGCDYVFLLNQDAWVERDTFTKLLTVHKKHPEYGILSPMHLTKEKDSLNFYLDDNKRNLGLLSDLYFGTIKDVYRITYVNAAAWLIPRKTLMTLGGFCPMIFHYGEDDDYLNRASYHKVKVGLCPSSRIVHDSKNRLNEGVSLFEKANEEKLDEYLDITKDYNLRTLRIRFLVKGVISLTKGKRAQAQSYFNKAHFIRENRSKIEYCRAQHRIEQPNWLV